MAVLRCQPGPTGSNADLAMHNEQIMAIECILDAKALVGECPRWSVAEQKLWWVDIDGCLLHRFDPATGLDEHWHLPSEPGCLAIHECGDVLLALREGVYRFNPVSAQLTLLARPDYDPGTTRFNDGRCDQAGRFWVGTLYEPRLAPQAQLYCFEAGQLNVRAGNVTVANGLAFSPDNRTLYWADSPAYRIDCFDFDLASGRISNRRLFHQFQHGAGRPDGAAVDRDGNYWIALYAGGAIVALRPDGSVLHRTPLPVLRPTMLSFGGAALNKLFITSARAGASEEELLQYPLSGGIFCMDVDVVGMAEPNIVV